MSHEYNPTLPDDVRDLLAWLDRTRAAETVVQFMGGELRLGDAMEKIRPVKREHKDIDDHIARWAKFERRWGKHPIIGKWATDMRVWEARRARIDLAIDRDWFYHLHPQTRLMLVRDERERQAGERHTKLARSRLKLLALPTQYTDPATSLRSA